MSGDRSTFKSSKKLIWGLHPEGILEIKINNPYKQNSFFIKTMKGMTDILEEANSDPRVKCVVLHGGK